MVRVLFRPFVPANCWSEKILISQSRNNPRMAGDFKTAEDINCKLCFLQKSPHTRFCCNKIYNDHSDVPKIKTAIKTQIINQIFKMDALSEWSLIIPLFQKIEKARCNSTEPFFIGNNQIGLEFISNTNTNNPWVNVSISSYMSTATCKGHVCFCINPDFFNVSIYNPVSANRNVNTSLQSAAPA